MIAHSKQLPRSRVIRRGNQFSYLSGGSMVGLGSRQPSGGPSSNAYRAYEGMSANSLDDIDMLFNHAEVHLLLFWDEWRLTYICRTISSFSRPHAFTITHYIKGSKNLAACWIDWEDLPATSTTALTIPHPSTRMMTQFLVSAHNWSGRRIRHGRNSHLFRRLMDITLKRRQICCGERFFVLLPKKRKIHWNLIGLSIPV